MTGKPSEPVGSLETALVHLTRLLQSNPLKAEAQAREILKAVPGELRAQLLLATALHGQGRALDALAVLNQLRETRPATAAIEFETGLIFADLGDHRSAIAALTRATALDGNHPDAWRALGDALSLAGDSTGADAAYARHIRASVKNPHLLEAADALCTDRLAVAEHLLRQFLKEQPTDVAAIRMLAEIGTRLGHYEDAEHLLKRCLELAPGFYAARHNYAVVLYRQNKTTEALGQLTILMREDARNPSYRNLRAAALSRLGETTEAIAAYKDVLDDHPNQPKAWMSYGHTLKTAGLGEQSIAAYRKSIDQLPSFGEAYWSLANLKTFRFSRSDIANMQAQLARPDLSEEDRYHLHFALGKALEDEESFEESFDNYALGNALRRRSLSYSADDTSQRVSRAKDVFSSEFFSGRQGFGSGRRDPIFIVGLPRSGSTLVEQILASHSLVEGTMELPDIIGIAHRLGGGDKKEKSSRYPESLQELDRSSSAMLGEEYLRRTQIQRKSTRPFFIDKMPNNFLHIGLIHLILPRARIIDVRRHPMACGFSNFKQHFARGQGFAYDLDDIGRYYSDYVALMEHFDWVLPGRIHHLQYEGLIADSEHEVRRLLQYCELPYEKDCLQFHRTSRNVRTASSEQVRMPLFREALDHWRHFESHLDPLKQALGVTLQNYRAVEFSG